MPVVIRDQSDQKSSGGQSDNGLGSTIHADGGSGLSHNAKIAIGVAVPVCVLLALFVGFIVVAERKRRAAKRAGHTSTIITRPKISSYMERKGSRQPPLLQPEPHDTMQTPSTADSKFEKDFEQHELEDNASKFESFNFHEDDKPLPLRPPRNDSIVNSPVQSSPKQDDFAQARQQFMEAPQSPKSPQRHSTTELHVHTNRFSTMEDNNRFSNRHSTFIDSNRQTMVTVVDHDILEAVAEGRDSMQSMGVQEFTHGPSDELPSKHPDSDNNNQNRESNQSGYGIAITETPNHDNRHSNVWDIRRFSQRNPYQNRVSLHPNNTTTTDPRFSRMASSRYSKAPDGFDFNIEPPAEGEGDDNNNRHNSNSPTVSELTHVSEASHPNVFRASQRLSRLDQPDPDPWMRRLSVQEFETTKRVWLEPSADISEPKSA